MCSKNERIQFPQTTWTTERPVLCESVTKSLLSCPSPASAVSIFSFVGQPLLPWPSPWPSPLAVSTSEGPLGEETELAHVDDDLRDLALLEGNSGTGLHW